ncbi:MAG: hypothetical protein GC160_07350 [Acidobacteria bacterium]|nr:hypothetical protein [Acidobacteriota bacterium]
MSNLHIHNSRDLSAEERAVLERLLGRSLREGEAVGVQALRESPAPTGAERERAAEELRAAADALAMQIDPHASADELDSLIEEAIAAVRRERR